MKPFYDSAVNRWEAMIRDQNADSAGRSRLKDVQFSLESLDRAPTNTVWEYITLMLPQLVWTNPAISVSSYIPGRARYNTVGQKYALEALMRQQGWARIWAQVFCDALAWRGVTMVTTERNLAPRYMDGLDLVDWEGKKRRVESKTTMLSIPKLVYIHPEDFFIDSEVRTRDQARRMGHRWTDSRARLLRLAEDDKTWNRDAIRGAQKGSALDDDLVVLEQMYVPNYFDPVALDAYDGDEKPGEDELHHGTLYTMIKGSSGGIDAQSPRVYRGPASGPYELYECIPQPGKRVNGAPLGVCWPQIDLDGRVGEALNRSGESYKRQVIATAAIAEALINNENDAVVSVNIASEAMQGGIREIEVGGPSEQLIRAYAMTRDSLNRTLGLSDSQRGFAQKDTTATAESIADKSMDVKIAGIRAPLHASAERQIAVANWHIEHDDEFLIALPDEARIRGLEMLQEGGLPLTDEMMREDDGAITIWQGGDALKEAPISPFDAQTVRIEAMTMERTSEAMQQRRALQSAELTGKALEMLAMNPGFDARGWLEDMGQRMNLPGLGKYLPSKPQPGAPGAPGAPVSDPGPGGFPGNQSGAMAAQGAI